MITETILVITASIVGVLGITAFFYSCYKRCPSDRILVIYGMRTRSLSFRCIHGGKTFVWPFIQHHQFLDLTPIPIDAKLKGLKDKNNIPVNIPSTYTIGISTSPGVMENAAERLLGLDLTQIRRLGQDIIFGQLRAVIATIDIESINANRDLFIEKIAAGVEVELTKVGLRLINVNISDVQFKTA
jgi:flotillin